MNYLYPAIFHKDVDGYWAEFPDFDGCFSQGDDIDEIHFNASEALKGHILAMTEFKKKLPTPSDITKIKIVTDGDFVSLVSVDVKEKVKSVKKTLTIPSWLNEKAISENINFSQVLQNALIEKLGM